MIEALNFHQKYTSINDNDNDISHLVAWLKYILQTKNHRSIYELDCLNFWQSEQQIYFNMQTKVIKTLLTCLTLILKIFLKKYNVTIVNLLRKIKPWIKKYVPCQFSY